MVTEATDFPASVASDSLRRARQRRAELLRAIQDFERALAAPVGTAAWRGRVARQLHLLRREFVSHVDITEGQDGLYGALLDVAPRLVNEVHTLMREHSAVLATLDALDRRIESVEPERLRTWASDLLRELSRHRQRGADVVYDAYETDIGGES